MSDLSNGSGDASSERGKSPFTIWFWLAGGLIVAVIVAAVIVAVSSGGRAPETGSSSEPSPPPAAVPSESVCGLEPGDQSVPTTSAPETEWVLVGTMAAPSIEGVGPGEVAADGLRTCFAHSPVGALVAAANVAVQSSHPQLARSAIEYFLPNGTGKEAALEQNASNPPAGSAGVQLVGFQVLDYADDEATIDLAFRNSSGALASITSRLHWTDGDWRFEVQANGQQPFPTKQLTSLAGYVPWGGA